jgi:hypothetical protein
VTDREAKSGNYKHLTQGILPVGILTVAVTIYTNDGREDIVTDALTMLKSAIHSAGKASEATRNGQPGLSQNPAGCARVCPAGRGWGRDPIDTPHAVLSLPIDDRFRGYSCEPKGPMRGVPAFGLIQPSPHPRRLGVVRRLYS